MHVRRVVDLQDGLPAETLRAGAEIRFGSGHAAMTAIPQRIERAVAMLDVQPRSRLLEIGCGVGLAISCLCERERSATIVAIDRSSTMIDRARANNRDATISGRVVLQQASLAEATLPRAAFDIIFAVNVNIFWRDGAREIAIVRNLLAPKGSFWTFYEPPAATKTRSIAEAVRSALGRGGFAVDRIVDDPKGRKPFLAIAAKIG
jgi:SAM-dependent methyltransferase